MDAPTVTLARLELVNQAGAIVSIVASVQGGEFSAVVGVDACTQNAEQRLSGVVLQDYYGSESAWRDPDGDGVFTLTEDGVERGTRDLGVLVISSPLTEVAQPILRGISLEPIAEGIAADVWVDGASECLRPTVISFVRAESNFPCRPVLEGVSDMVSGYARPATVMRSCMGGGRWSVIRLALRSRSHPWDEVPIQDPDGLLPITIDLGGPAPYAEVPRIEEVAFRKDTYSFGTEIWALGNSDFGCNSSAGAVTFDTDRPDAPPINGVASIRDGRFKACAFIPKKWSPSTYQLSRIFVRPEYGCDLDLRAVNGALQDFSLPASGSELPSPLPSFDTP